MFANDLAVSAGAESDRQIGYSEEPLLQCSGNRDSVLSVFERLDHAEKPNACFMVASGGVLFEGYWHGGPGVSIVKADK